MGCPWQSDRTLKSFPCVFLEAVEHGGLFLLGWEIWVGPRGDSRMPSSCLLASLTNLLFCLWLGHTLAQTLTLTISYSPRVRVPPVSKASDGLLPALSSPLQADNCSVLPCTPLQDWQALRTFPAGAAPPPLSSGFTLPLLQFWNLKALETSLKKKMSLI